MNRRELLAILGVGGAGATGGYYLRNSEDSGSEKADESRFQTVDSMYEGLKGKHLDAPDLTPAQTYEYEEIDAKVPESVSEYISYISAYPVEGSKGDHLVFTPGNGDNIDLKGFVTAFWDLPKEMEISVNTDSYGSITMTGGSIPAFTALVGTTAESKKVFVARSESKESIEAVARSNWR